MNFEFKILHREGSKCKVKIRDTGEYIWVDADPFGNCQNFSIAYFNSFMTLTRNQNRKERMKELKDLIYCYKPYLIVDVSRYYSDQIKKHFSVFKSMPYTNKTGTDMNIVIIDTTK